MAKSLTSSRRQLSFPGGAICKLCQGHHSHMSSPVDWKNEQARTYVLSLKVPSDSLVCRPCRDDVTRVLRTLVMYLDGERARLQVRAVIVV